jgi:uncharacterized membrane-anchored protein
MITSTPNTTKSSRPWIWIVAAFTVMIAFWSVVVTIAVKKLPASVPMASAAPPSDARN